MQNAFIIGIILILLGLIAEGLLTGSIWVKGGRNGMGFCHKKSKTEEPLWFWGLICFYGFFALFLSYKYYEEKKQIQTSYSIEIKKVERIA